jgi:hypothetical protein
MELDPPKAKYTFYGEDGDFPLIEVQRRYLNNGFSILRYNDRESVVYLHDCVVPITVINVMKPILLHYFSFSTVNRVCDTLML